MDTSSSFLYFLPFAQSLRLCAPRSRAMACRTACRAAASSSRTASRAPRAARRSAPVRHAVATEGDLEAAAANPEAAAAPEVPNPMAQLEQEAARLSPADVKALAAKWDFTEDDLDKEKLYAELDSMLGKQNLKFTVGDRISGVVYKVDSRGAFVDIGAKAPAYLPIAEVAIIKPSKVLRSQTRTAKSQAHRQGLGAPRGAPRRRLRRAARRTQTGNQPPRVPPAARGAAGAAWRARARRQAVETLTGRKPCSAEKRALR